MHSVPSAPFARFRPVSDAIRAPRTCGPLVPNDGASPYRTLRRRLGQAPDGHATWTCPGPDSEPRGCYSRIPPTNVKRGYEVSNRSGLDLWPPSLMYGEGVAHAPDLLEAMQKKRAHEPFLAWLEERLAGWDAPGADAARSAARRTLAELAAADPEAAVWTAKAALARMADAARRWPPRTLSQTGQGAATASSRSSTRAATCAVNPSRPLLRARRGSGSRGPAVRLSGTTEFPMPPRPLRHPGRTKRDPGSRGWGETRAGPHGARDAETALDVIQGPLALKNAQALGNAADLEDPWFPSCDVRFGIQGSSTPRSKRQGVLHPVSSVDRTNTATGIEAAPRVLGR